MPITVLIVDDNDVMRMAVRSLLRASGGFQIVGEACDGLQAVRLAAEHHPDVVVLDLDLPGLSGLQATRQIRKQATPAAVVVLSGTADAGAVSESLRSGAAAVVAKHRAFEELIVAIERAAAA